MSNVIQDLSTLATHRMDFRFDMRGEDKTMGPRRQVKRAGYLLGAGGGREGAGEGYRLWVLCRKGTRGGRVRFEVDWLMWPGRNRDFIAGS